MANTFHFSIETPAGIFIEGDDITQLEVSTAHGGRMPARKDPDLPRGGMDNVSNFSSHFGGRRDGRQAFDPARPAGVVVMGS